MRRRGSPDPRGPTAIGPYTATNEANGNQANTVSTDTSDQNAYVSDDENRVVCSNRGC